jgi:hypothetical protein
VVNDAQRQHDQLPIDREPWKVGRGRPAARSSPGRPSRPSRPDLRTAAERRETGRCRCHSLGPDVEEMAPQTLMVGMRHALATARGGRRRSIIPSAANHRPMPARVQPGRHYLAAPGSARGRAGSRRARRRSSHRRSPMPTLRRADAGAARGPCSEYPDGRCTCASRADFEEAPLSQPSGGINLHRGIWVVRNWLFRFMSPFVPRRIAARASSACSCSARRIPPNSHLDRMELPSGRISPSKRTPESPRRPPLPFAGLLAGQSRSRSTTIRDGTTTIPPAGSVQRLPIATAPLVRRAASRRQMWTRTVRVGADQAGDPDARQLVASARRESRRYLRHFFPMAIDHIELDQPCSRSYTCSSNRRFA